MPKTKDLNFFSKLGPRNINGVRFLSSYFSDFTVYLKYYFKLVISVFILKSTKSVASPWPDSWLPQASFLLCSVRPKMTFVNSLVKLKVKKKKGKFCCLFLASSARSLRHEWGWSGSLLCRAWMVHKDRKATWGPESQAWKRSVVLAPLGGTGLVLRGGQLSRPQKGSDRL